MAEGNRMDEGAAFSQQAKAGGEQNLGQQVGTGVSQAQSMPPSSSTRQPDEAARRSIGERYQSNADQGLDNARANLTTFQQKADEYVRENPVRAVLTAVGLGFVLGLLSRR